MTAAGSGTAPFATRYRAVCRARTRVRVPAYAGSALRGPFGLALRRLSCITGSEHCDDCPLFRACAYPEIFETPPRQDICGVERDWREVPRPYVIEPDGLGVRQVPKGGVFQFFVGLMGRAQRYADLVRKAFMLSGRGGTDWGEFELAEFAVHDAATLPLPAAPRNDQIGIEFRTPLRINKRGKILDARSLDFSSFTWALLHRLQRLDAVHGAYPMPIDADAVLAAARQIRESNRALRWTDAVRRSNRQGRRIPLGGLTGNWIVHGDLRTLWPLLYAGQWTHVGKGATFGLGQYRLARGVN